MVISYGEGTGIISREPVNSQTYVCAYIPTYSKHHLKWFEKTGLLTLNSDLFIDQFKHKQCNKNKEEWLKNQSVVNFDTIHACCGGSSGTKSVRE